MTAASDVRHNETDHQFELPVDGELAFVTYYRNGDVIEFLHTEVPEAAEGKGIASKVVSAALEYARAHGLRVVARCSYVASYLHKHRDRYPGLVVETASE